jgi:hypothetical protein
MIKGKTRGAITWKLLHFTYLSNQILRTFMIIVVIVFPATCDPGVLIKTPYLKTSVPLQSSKAKEAVKTCPFFFYLV